MTPFQYLLLFLAVSFVSWGMFLMAGAAGAAIWLGAFLFVCLVFSLGRMRQNAFEEMEARHEELRRQGDEMREREGTRRTSGRII